jgi:hypothetical protein
MDDDSQRISEESEILKESISNLVRENYPKGVNALVLSYVGADMLAQSVMSLFSQGEFITIDEGRESVIELLTMCLREYEKHAAITGNIGFPMQ